MSAVARDQPREQIWRQNIQRVGYGVIDGVPKVSFRAFRCRALADADDAIDGKNCVRW